MAYVRTRRDGVLGEVYVPEEEDDNGPPTPPAKVPTAAGDPPTSPIAGPWDSQGGGGPFGFAAPFGATVSVPWDAAGPGCSTDERRVHPVVQAPPSALVPVALEHVLNPRRRMLADRATYAAYLQLKAAAEQAGIASPLMKIVSGFRGIEEQRGLWNKALARYGSADEARKWVAPPGSSVHQTGRALDLWLGRSVISRNVAPLRRTAAYHFLVCNAARFGFFPYAREPWHWEFNPPAAATGLNGPGRRPGFGEPAPQPRPPAPSAGGALAALAPLVGPHTAGTAANALAIVRALSSFHGIPWIVPFVVLEHEGGVSLFRRHPDGVMQTIAGARRSAAPRIPREVKLALLGRPANDPTPDAALAPLLLAAFPTDLAVQIAFGTQELLANLSAINNYVALALIGYNAGTGNAIRAANNGAARRKPHRISPSAWEQRCLFGASLYHLLPASLAIGLGQWQCDRNLGPTGWFASIPVQVPGGIQLIAYQYLRSIRRCIHRDRPHLPCDAAHHGASHRVPGTGPVACTTSRPGALDKIYDPTLLGAPYRAAAGALLQAIPQDQLPLKCAGPALLKLPALLTPPP